MKKIFIFIFLVGLSLSHSGAKEETRLFRVIVHPSNQTRILHSKELSNIFLRKVKFWPNEELILAVDLPIDSAVRKNFSEHILERSVMAVRSYWQQMIFSGRDVPPPELKSDDEIVSYVLNHANAIGYVSINASIKTAKIISIE